MPNWELTTEQRAWSVKYPGQFGLAVEAAESYIAWEEKQARMFRKPAPNPQVIFTDFINGWFQAKTEEQDEP